jgi:hypothetical protein
MENTASSVLFAVHKWSPNTRKVFIRFWRIRGKNLCVYGEDPMAYSPYKPREKNTEHISFNNGPT